MRTRSVGSKSREGAALIFSVMAVMVVSILAAGFLQLSMSVTRRLGSASDQAQALNIAEAGLAEAYTGLGAAHSGNVGTPEQPAFFGGGLFWVEATDHGSFVELESTAMYGTGRATLGMVCEPESLNIAALGFFTEENLRLNPDVRLDSYDSSQGSYAGQLNTSLNNQGLVGSNGNVSIASGNKIFGDVVYGPTGKIDIAAGSVVTGGTAARPALEELPPVEVPDVPTKTTAVKYIGATPMVVAPGEAGYSSLSIGKASKLILKGPLTFVVGSFSLALGAELVFDTTDGPVEMYVTDSIDLATGSLVSTTTQVTSDSIIMVSAPEGKTVSFGAKSQFYGFIYAPEAEVHMAATYELYGGMVCKELNLAAQGKMHADLKLGATLESTLPAMMAWRVVELPQPVAAQRTDPFHLLDIDPSALLSPAESHQDQLLEVVYVAQDGSTDTYFGAESDFDWSLVQELLYGVRDGLAFFLTDDYANGSTGNDPLTDLVASTLSSKQLRDALLGASPGVSPEALAAACLRNPPMSSSDLASVLAANKPLSGEVLTAAIGSAALSSSALKGVLIANSPLSPEVLTSVLTRNPPLSLGDLAAVLAKQ